MEVTFSETVDKLIRWIKELEVAYNQIDDPVIKAAITRRLKQLYRDRDQAEQWLKSQGKGEQSPAG